MACAVGLCSVMAHWVASCCGQAYVERPCPVGGNVHGLTNLRRDSKAESGWQLLKEAVPKLFRVAVLYDPAMPGSLHEVKELLPADARALKLTIQPWEIRGWRLR